MVTAAATALAAAAGLVACGDDDGSSNRSGGSAGLQVSPNALSKGVADAPPRVKGAAAPNVLGGNGEITRVLDRLDRDLPLFYSETLGPFGVSLKPPAVRRFVGAGRCDGQPLKATAVPRWCEAENAVVQSVAGADEVRRDDGAVVLYVLVAWAHAQAVGDQLGWHDAERAGKLTASQVGEGEFCLLASWIGHTSLQGLFEEADSPTILDAFNTNAVFADIPGAARQRGFDRGRIGPEVCAT